MHLWGPTNLMCKLKMIYNHCDNFVYTNYQLSTTNYQLPTTNYQLPTISNNPKKTTPVTQKQVSMIYFMTYRTIIRNVKYFYNSNI